MITEEEIRRFELKLTAIRNAVGWSAEEFGERIGVSRQTINNLENRKYKLTKTTYIAMRYVLDTEIKEYPEETEMLKVILDVFVDHPEKYKEEAKEKILKESNLLSPAMKSKTSNRKEVSSEWKEILIGLGVITATAVSAILIGTWRSK